MRKHLLPMFFSGYSAPARKPLDPAKGKSLLPTCFTCLERNVEEDYRHIAISCSGRRAEFLQLFD